MRLFHLSRSTSPSSTPPAWTPAPEPSHKHGLYAEATDDEYTSAQRFCATHPLDAPRLLSSSQLSRITTNGCAAWSMQVPPSDHHRFVGHITNDPTCPGPTIISERQCQSVSILSDIPLIAAKYDIPASQRGVYYEITILRVDGIVALGTACRPYPPWRFPGWDRLSAGFHLDDGRKFFEDPDGGRDYVNLHLNPIYPGVTLGCGYDFVSASIFYTYDGYTLPTAFSGVYLPHHAQDVFAAIGVEGRCEVKVNFGTSTFKWKDGNESSWRVDGNLSRTVDDLPRYQERT